VKTAAPQASDPTVANVGPPAWIVSDGICLLATRGAHGERAELSATAAEAFGWVGKGVEDWAEDNGQIPVLTVDYKVGPSEIKTDGRARLVVIDHAQCFYRWRFDAFRGPYRPHPRVEAMLLQPGRAPHRQRSRSGGRSGRGVAARDGRPRASRASAMPSYPHAFPKTPPTGKGDSPYFVVGDPALQRRSELADGLRWCRTKRG
jgi:hypothetical protein